MQILSTIGDAIRELRATLGSVSRVTKGPLGSGTSGGADDARFFRRETDSVARMAKKSVLFYPVVASESLAPDTVAMLSKLVQVRAAEYTKLLVANLNPVELAQGGKDAVFNALRGASLSDGETGTDYAAAAGQIGGYLKANGVAIGESFASSEIELHPAVEILSEGKSRRNDRPDREGGQYKYEAPRFRQTGSSASTADQGSAASKEDIEDHRGEKTVSRKALKDEAAARKAAEDAAARSKKERDEALSKADVAEKARLEAEHTMEAAQRAARAHRDEQVAKAKQLAAQGDHAGAADIVNQFFFSKDDDAIAKLRQNPATARLVDIAAKMPRGVAPEEVQALNKTSTWTAPAYEKLNRIVPVVLELGLKYQAADGKNYDTTIALGVRSTAHVVPAADVVTALGTALQRDSLVLQFLRLTSGETEFVKDFVLNVDVAKRRVTGNMGTKVLETLRRQAEWNAKRSNVVIASLTKRGFVPPTTTLVITADEAAQIRSLYGVDFTKPATVRELLQSHNLMGFMIVDEAIGLVRVFEDGDADFDRVPFSEVKDKGKETSVKDILTIMARN